MREEGRLREEDRQQGECGIRAADGMQANGGMWAEGSMKIAAPRMEGGARAALIACSNGLSKERQPRLEALAELLREQGFSTVCSGCLYARRGTAFSGMPKERAGALMECFDDPGLSMIFDVSGGDTANGILPYLDYERIRKSRALFFGYSDLTTVINAIYTKTGKSSVLYQARNLVEPGGERQRKAFQRWLAGGDGGFFSFSCRFLQGRRMEGVVIGGNMRCLLKLAGTEYWPDMRGKLLLLEASGGGAPQMACYLAQLKQLGVFEQIGGILLGTFLGMEGQKEGLGIGEMVLEYAKHGCPVAMTAQIGHRSDSHGAVIGGRLSLTAGD